MPRYIDAEALIEKFKDPLLFNVMPRHLQIIMETPTADVEAVRHEHWLEEDGIQICSGCGEEHDWDDYRAPYCDTCGAKMDGEEV